MKTFRTQQLATEFYHLTRTLKMPNHLKEQFDRASASVSLNLAEGNAKFSYKDKSRIYQIAYGSFRECQAVLELANINDDVIQAKSKHLGSSLYRLIESTMKRSSTSIP